jgi:hypothetical protein
MRGLAGLHAAHDSVRECAQCKVNTECPTETPVCDVAHGGCVECGTTADCKALQECVSGACSGCTVANSCGACGHTCAEAAQVAFHNLARDIQCGENKCSADILTSSRAACNTLCAPWKCSDATAYYGPSSVHENDVTCSDVPPATSANEPFNAIACTCTE